MVFKTTSTKRRLWGMTLTELLVATAAGSIVLTSVASLSFYTGRSVAALANYVELDQDSRKALDTISQQIRQTSRLLEGSSTSLTFEDYDGAKLSFIWDAAAKTLTRYKDGQPDPTPLLKECGFLEFSMFQRNPMGGTYDQYPAATPATCKLIQVKWICSRSIFGTTLQNTESVQSAKIVIRKQ